MNIDRLKTSDSNWIFQRRFRSSSVRQYNHWCCRERFSRPSLHRVNCSMTPTPVSNQVAADRVRLPPKTYHSCTISITNRWIARFPLYCSRSCSFLPAVTASHLVVVKPLHRESHQRTCRLTNRRQLLFRNLLQESPGRVLPSLNGSVRLMRAYLKTYHIQLIKMSR